MDFFERTIGSGLVSNEQLLKTITIVGWVNKRRDHGGLIFVDLRDRSGIMQIVFNPEFNEQAHKNAHDLRSEFVISVTGKVVNRTKENINADIATGKFELHAESLIILNKSKVPPFLPSEAGRVDEELRLKYRYIDLRRKEMCDRMKRRHELIFSMRELLHQQDFYEIETPILTKNTAEGAREFLVPCRLQQGMFYALPQSPQVYKQMLMAGGIERYFQVARCFRDEDLRADRQPEFTQLDIEMSFVKEDDIIKVVEDVIKYSLKKILNIEVNIPFKRISYDYAMKHYGSDKPDTRFEMRIMDLTDLFKNSELSFIKAVLDKGGKVGALRAKNRTFSRSELDGWVKRAMKHGAKGLVWIRFRDGKIESPISKFLPDNFFEVLKSFIPDIDEGDTLFLVAGKYLKAWDQLGRIRLEIGKELDLIDESRFDFLWVTDFPLLEYDESEKRWFSVHHPFTRPEQGWQHKQLHEIKARAYDIVLNGVEIGGGSIRIHEPELQSKIFDLLGMKEEEAEGHFGFLLEAQNLGFPPHGGIALGLDRLMMLLLGCKSIREVIAFPKTQSGIDPMMQAPTKVSDEKLKDYLLKSIEPAE